MVVAGLKVRSCLQNLHSLCHTTLQKKKKFLISMYHVSFNLFHNTSLWQKLVFARFRFALFRFLKQNDTTSMLWNKTLSILCLSLCPWVWRTRLQEALEWIPPTSRNAHRLRCKNQEKEMVLYWSSPLRPASYRPNKGSSLQEIWGVPKKTSLPCTEPFFLIDPNPGQSLLH